MNKYKIVICGTPQVGKGTLLFGLGEFTGFQAVSRFSETEPNRFLTVQYQSNALHFVTGGGAYLYVEPMIQTLLPQASAVIYVLSPAYRSNGRPHLSDDQHRRYLDFYLHHAQRLKVGWDHVPWLLVLNKTDLAEYLPTEASLFPVNLRQNYVRCIASEGVGVVDVWKRLLELLHLPASENPFE